MLVDDPGVFGIGQAGPEHLLKFVMAHVKEDRLTLVGVAIAIFLNQEALAQCTLVDGGK